MKKTIILKESELISLIERIIKESIDIEGKTVRTYTQNGDKSYDVVFDDGSKKTIWVSHDAWDDINTLHRNALSEETGTSSVGSFSTALGKPVRRKIRSGLAEGKDKELNYSFILNILKKMYGYNISIDDLKLFENTEEYSQTENSYNYIEQYNDYMDEIKGVKHYFDRFKLKEETGSSSTGSYETPGFLAKNIPNMRQGAKTTYGGKGGKFVKIKNKCRKFPYCSQGSVDNPIELSDKYKGESSLSGEMELTPTYPKGYKGNTKLTKTKWVNESYELSNNDKLKDNWAVFKVMYGKKFYVTGLNEGNTNKIDEFNDVKYSNEKVLKFTYKEALGLVKENGGFGIKIGVVNDKGIQKVYDMSNKKGYITTSDDVKYIQEEGVKDNILLGYDKLRDSIYRLYYVGKALGKFGYNFPSLYRDFKKHKGDKDALLLVVAKYKAELESYMDELFKNHPNYEIKRILKKLTAELKELENLTLDNFEKTPEKFTKHQTDILLKRYNVTPDGVKRTNESKEAIPGGLSSGIDIREIAKKHKVSPQIAMKEWLKGIKVEMEHTNNKKIGREIAKDHLYEDIYYYKKLAKIEK